MKKMEIITDVPEHAAGRVREMRPLALGAYLVSCNGTKAAFGVSILGNAALVGKVARIRPAGLCIAGRSETGSKGLDEVIKDTIARPRARYLIVCGAHREAISAFRTFAAVKTNGVDEEMRVAGLAGTPVIINGVSKDEVEAFKEHIEVVDMTMTDDVDAIIAKIDRLSRSCPPDACDGCIIREKPRPIRPAIHAIQGLHVPGLDKAGFFIIRLDGEKGMLTVEHYHYDCRLIRRIVGTDKRAIFRAIIDNGWATQSSHVAYLWRELGRAEKALESGHAYVQDAGPL